MKTPIATLALAAGLVAALAGCTSSHPTTSATSATTKSPSPAATSTTAPSPTATSYQNRAGVADASQVTAPDKKVNATCKNGAATISENSAEITLKSDCAKVTVTAGNSIVHLGDVKELVVKGNINRVEAGSVDKVTVEKNAKGNDVLYTGSKPTIDDKGSATRFAESK